MTATSVAIIDGTRAKSMELEEGEPWPAERTADGRPIGKRSVETWRNADGSLWSGVWEVDQGKFWATFEGYGEFLYVVSGEMECLGDDGSQFTLRAGDTATFPRGWTGWWDVRSPLRKCYSAWRHD
jgi:uncharacterized cupin superfamily protein